MTETMIREKMISIMRKPMANRNECVHGKTREGARDEAFEAEVVND